MLEFKTDINSLYFKSFSKSLGRAGKDDEYIPREEDAQTHRQSHQSLGYSNAREESQHFVRLFMSFWLEGSQWEWAKDGFTSPWKRVGQWQEQWVSSNETHISQLSNKHFRDVEKNSKIGWLWHVWAHTLASSNYGISKDLGLIFLLVKKGYALIRGSVRFKGISSIDLKSNDYVCNYTDLKYPMLVLKEPHVCMCVYLLSKYVLYA